MTAAGSLQSNADDVVVRLLCGQHGAGGLGVHAQHPGFRVGRAKALFHDFSPYTAGSAEFRDFFEHIVVGVPEEGQAAGKIVDIQSGFDGGFAISDAVGDREGDFL